MPSQQFPEHFGAGSIVAGRYQMVVRLGRGGMGEVWRAEDLILKIPVALKRLFAGGPEARLRLLHEVRLARQITHPAVCRVFDVGESDGDVFYSMELIEGEDLATLLGHAGRLPSDTVVDLAHQLCDGLSAAHAAGVLHRDLKPANVLIDGQGKVRITDFGIAVSQSEADAAPMLGTPEYMAPEQLVRGASLTEETDIYALGLILFELVTGEHALNAGSIVAPVPPSRLVPDIDARLDQTIFRAISPEPRQRFASAADMAAALPPLHAEARPAAARPRWIWPTAAGVLAAIAIVAAMWLVPSMTSGTTLTAQDTIVLADFQNRTGEPVFDRALKVALAVALEQSPFLKVFPDDRAADTLRLMGREPTEPVTRSLAREIAQREHLKALIAGTISRLGQHYVIAIEATNAETGDTMAIAQVEAATQEDVLTALGGATTRLRETLGESLASIRKFDVPLPRATTPSLEALSAYARALDDGRMDLRLEAIPQLKRALELDPDFALAQAQLSAVYTNTGQTGLAPQHSRRAFELRDRVSDRERFFIAFRYHRDATQDWQQALDVAQAWTVAYPREPLAFNALGIARLRFGDYEGAIAPIREAMRLDPKFAPLYSNLAGVLMSLGRMDEAKRVLHDGEALGIDYFNAHRMAYLIAFVEHDQATIDEHVKAGLRLDQNNSAFGWKAHASSFQGRFAEAHEQFRVGSEVAAKNGFAEVAARLAIEDLEGRALVGLCGNVSAEVARALAWSRDNFALERSARALILCRREAEAERLIDEVKARYPEATLVHRISLPIMEALTALNHDQPAQAVKALEPVRPFDHAPWSGYWPALLRGQAYLALGDAAAARREFQSILSHRGEDPDSLLYPLAQLGMARASARAGDADGGRAEYLRLLQMWGSADADLPIVVEARRIAGSPAANATVRVN